MTKTIGNPLSWSAHGIGVAGSAVVDGVSQISGTEDATPEIRDIGLADIRAALRKGRSDMVAFRSDVFFAIVFYPLVAILLVSIETDMTLLPLLFPLLAGCVLLGPLTAVGLYEMSRRRESGEPVNWGDAFGVLRSPSLVPLALLGVALLVLFFFWVGAAAILYDVTLGPEPPASLGTFATDVFGTAAGWAMLLLGCGIGFVFACVVLATSVVSFPLLLERNVGLVRAVTISAQVTRRNPHTILVWGFIVAIALLVGALPLLLGLIFVMPILGHSTWYLYRAAVRLDPAQGDGSAET